jgi:hypothetical protein
MSLLKLQFKPGIVHDVSRYTNSGGWADCNLIRFRFGLPQSMLGWVKYSTSLFLGSCRGIHNWLTLIGQNLLFVPTDIKVYIEDGGNFFDITPLRATNIVANPFAATNGSSTLTVNHTAHGAEAGDYVTISGATALGGNVTATVLNTNYPIAFVVDSNTYRITLPVTANASDTGNGGATVTFEYEIQIGLNTQVGGGGWGASTWGRDTWGSAVDVTTQVELRLWYQDNFGEDLVFNIRNGQIYYWDATGGTSGRAVTLVSLSSDATCPTIASQVLVSDKDRHVIAFGTDNGDGIQDPLLIRFSDMENPFVWETLATNSAGDLLLGSGSEIIRALETKREIIIFTDATIYSMQFLGPPYTFGVQQIAGFVSIVGPNTAIAVDDVVFWMTKSDFAVYDGAVRDLQCTVRDYVFNDMNNAQSDKFFAAHVPEQGEVTWYYCSFDSDEPDKYVTFNYNEKVWYYGMLDRTAWCPASLRSNPIAAANDGYLYYHEIGTDADGTPMNAYIESSPIELNTEGGPGERMMLISRILHDVDFSGSTAVDPEVIFTLKTSRYPGSATNYTATPTATETAATPVSQFTEYTDLRLRGRQVTIRAEKTEVGVNFTFGSPRIEVRPDGRR